LAGVGVRVKKIGPAAVKVYGLGVYVDERGAKSALAKYNKTLYACISWDEITKHSPGRQIFSPHTRRRLRQMNVKGDGAGQNCFAFALLGRSPLRLCAMSHSACCLFFFALWAGEYGSTPPIQFGFACKPGSLCVSINGKAAGTVSSKALSSALQDVYLGAKAVSQGAKDSTADGIAKMLG
ncbi:unnamed protein product, partial [Phaeothamnion confervicola]